MKYNPDKRDFTGGLGRLRIVDILQSPTATAPLEDLLELLATHDKTKPAVRGDSMEYRKWLITKANLCYNIELARSGYGWKDVPVLEAVNE